MNPWVKYSQGRWTRETPKEPGTYTVTTADPELLGCAPGHSTIHVVRMPNGDLYVTNENFKGYWWSEPLPDLPTVASQMAN